jgi:uncharacterized membrane protein
MAFLPLNSISSILIGVGLILSAFLLAYVNLHLHTESAISPPSADNWRFFIAHARAGDWRLFIPFIILALFMLAIFFLGNGFSQMPSGGPGDGGGNHTPPMFLWGAS